MQKGQPVHFEDSSDEENDVQQEEFYTYGIEQLTEARKFILEYSTKSAKNRLQRHADELNVKFSDRKKLRHEFYTKLNVNLIN